MSYLYLFAFFFAMAFFFLWMAHEFLKRQIRKISAKRYDDPHPHELEYPFFTFTDCTSMYDPSRQRGHAAIQIDDRDDFIRAAAPQYYERFILQERILRLMTAMLAALGGIIVLALLILWIV